MECGNCENLIDIDKSQDGGTCLIDGNFHKFHNLCDVEDRKNKEMKRVYIDDFVEDLNYQNIILYIGNVDADWLLERLKKDKVNHLYYFENVLANQLMFIENCDLQLVNTDNLTDYGNSLLALLEQGCRIYPLYFDGEKYYVEEI